MSKGRRRVSPLKQGEQIHPPFSFCSIWDPKELEDARPLWGGPCALFSSPTEMPVSSRNILMDMPRNNAYQLSGIPQPVKLTHNINHHKHEEEN